ncbi:hypothetical protein DET0649 [Dehalococcoides mccartyi 195]|uniref:Uncharacterized protein n=1 Tax=Dehalococcoides mccartyi (strain ATCC BAA-2266 / KCTC 15142 / 195) TaxID=243164 RepID=Q3Z8M4_DEHM1|nr:hypothetical protein DET0683 [Dehalococcoides mccartyi 195]AAW40117.1 hypothetical protein DET0649 [Dehalococcoides mccartyi 195]
MPHYSRRYCAGIAPVLHSKFKALLFFIYSARHKKYLCLIGQRYFSHFKMTTLPIPRSAW